MSIEANAIRAAFKGRDTKQITSLWGDMTRREVAHRGCRDCKAIGSCPERERGNEERKALLQAVLSSGLSPTGVERVGNTIRFTWPDGQTHDLKYGETSFVEALKSTARGFWRTKRGTQANA